MKHTKKYLKIILTLSIITFMLFSNLNIVKAEIDTSAYRSVTSVSDVGAFAQIGGNILYIAQFIGYSVAVIMLAVMGIKYMISSPEQKADLKSRFIPYAIGAALLFSGSTLLSIIYNIMH